MFIVLIRENNPTVLSPSSLVKRERERVGERKLFDNIRNIILFILFWYLDKINFLKYSRHAIVKFFLS